MPPREFLNFISNLSPQERAVYKQLMESRTRATALTPTANVAPTTLTTTGGGGGGGGGAARLPSGGGGGQIIPANQTTATGGSPRARVPSGRPVVDARVVSPYMQRLGAAGRGLRAAGRYSGPVALGLSLIDSAQIASSEEAREEADERFSGMDKGFASNFGKIFMSPVDYLYGAGSSLIDSYYDGKEYDLNKDVDARTAHRMAQRAEAEEAEEAAAMVDEAVSAGLAPAFEDIRSLGNLEPSEEDDPYSQENIDAGSLTDPNYKDKKAEGSAEPELSLDEIEARDIAASAREMGEEKAPAAKEEEPKEDFTQQAIDLFQTAHYTPYDPKSSTDKKKLAQMVEKLERDGGLGEKTANQFSLEYYREFGYV